jgi:energy-coupling factor transporter transmembrane protein EcfT
MKFSSRKSIFFRILILGSVVFFTILYIFGIFSGWIEPRDFWIGIPFSGMIALLLWIYLGTTYVLTETELIYKSGPLRGRIQLDQIREIVKGKTRYAGIKPATAGKGLIIKFRKYDEIYISPESNETFLSEIGKRNPEILISE